MRAATAWIGVLVSVGVLGCGKPAGDAGAPGSGGRPAAEAEFRSPADLITDEMFLAAVLHPSEIIKSPLLAPLLESDRGRAMLTSLAFDLSSVDEMVFFASRQTGGGVQPAGSATLLARFREAGDRNARMDALARSMGIDPTRREEITHEGRTYYRLRPGMPEVLCWLDDRTMLTSPEPTLGRILSGQGRGGALAERFRAADLSGDLTLLLAMDAFPQALADQIKAGQQKSPHGAALAAALDHLKGLTLSVELGGDPLARLSMEAKDGDGAVQLEQAVIQGRDMARAALTALALMTPPEQRQKAAPMIQLGQEALAGIAIVRDASLVALTVARPASIDRALPEMFAEAQEAADQASDRAGRTNALKQIALAMHNHHDAFNSFPASATRSQDGKPLLSWRVQLLPFLGEQGLYGEFHLDEPWDSPHNAGLLERMPTVYATPGQEDGKTSIVVFAGEGTPFGGAQGPRFRDITDGASNTILCVEAGPERAVPWTKPEDLPFDPANPAAALGNVVGGQFLAALCDGTVRSIDVDLDPKILGNLITHADGQRVPDF